MKGPSFNPGVYMGNEVEQRWSPEDIQIADRFLEASHKFPGKFNERKNRAAQELGYRSYIAMPDGAKSYISHVGQETKKHHQGARIVLRMKDHLKKMNEDWANLFANDPSFRHAMTHPEDGAIPGHSH
jgi:hypothetical protein